jgi:exo-1,4-beta-D-glucosaminidase
LNLFLPALFVAPFFAHAATVHPLHDGWRLQSACTLKADGAAISAAGFAIDEWIKA